TCATLIGSARYLHRLSCSLGNSSKPRLVNISCTTHEGLPGKISATELIQSRVWQVPLRLQPPCRRCSASGGARRPFIFRCVGALLPGRRGASCCPESC